MHAHHVDLVKQRQFVVPFIGSLQYYSPQRRPLHLLSVKVASLPKLAHVLAFVRGLRNRKQPPKHAVR